VLETPQILQKLEHSFTNYVSDNNATYTKNGTETAKCDRCNKTHTREDEGSMLQPIDKGTLTINMPTEIYSNYPGKEITITFSNPEYSSEVEFTTSDSRVIIENGKIKATGNFEQAINVIIETSSTHHETQQFTVKVSTYDGGINAEKKIQYLEENIIKDENKDGTIFIGDSYFDGYTKNNPPFWKDFYTDYQNEDKIFLMGISSSQIHHLEIFSERIVYPMQPSEIVMHIGFNDVHSGNLTVDEIYTRIITLCEKFKTQLPNVKIYFTGVEPKKNGYTAGTQFYESSTIKAPALTAKIKDYAKNNEWFIYVDTMNVFIDENGKIKTDSYLSTDLSHPTLAAYDEIRKIINEARGVENYKPDNTKFTIQKFGNAEGINSSGRTYTTSAGNSLTNNYIISGKLEITSINKSNAHLQFRFSNGTRFLLWDANNDGVVGTGYMCSGLSNKSDKTSSSKLFDANNGLSLNWAVIINEEKAYFYINNELVEKLDNPTLEYFNIGALQMNVEFSEIELTIKSENETLYNEKLLNYNIN
jgi:lysophospholipase L1-like esterase